MNSNKEIIEKIIDVVNNTAPDSEVYLYGSRARGKASSTSDWDLLILLNMRNIPFAFETKVMDDFYEIEVETGEVISPLIYTKKEWEEQHFFTPLYENIQKEGIKIK